MHAAATDSDQNSEIPKFTIREISEIHQQLLQAFAGANRLCLDIDDDAQVDLSFVQLIESARRYAEENGKTLLIARPAGANVRTILERCGLANDDVRGSARFWFHEEVAA